MLPCDCPPSRPVQPPGCNKPNYPAPPRTAALVHGSAPDAPTPAESLQLPQAFGYDAAKPPDSRAQSASARLPHRARTACPVVLLHSRRMNRESHRPANPPPGCTAPPCPNHALTFIICTVRGRLQQPQKSRRQTRRDTICDPVAQPSGLDPDIVSQVNLISRHHLGLGSVLCARHVQIPMARPKAPCESASTATSPIFAPNRENRGAILPPSLRSSQNPTAQLSGHRGNSAKSPRQLPISQRRNPVQSTRKSPSTHLPLSKTRAEIPPRPARPDHRSAPHPAPCAAAMPDQCLINVIGTVIRPSLHTAPCNRRPSDHSSNAETDAPRPPIARPRPSAGC